MGRETVALINGVKITGYQVDDEIFKDIEKIKENKGFVIINYMYWVPFVKSRKSLEYRNSLELSDFIFPDGVGLLTYIKVLYKKKLRNLNGTDLNPVLLKYFSEKKYNIAFYGTKKENLEKCVNNLKERNIKLIYWQDGYSELNFEKIEADSVLFIGMGSPIQEIWVKNNLEKIKEKKLIVITVGGYFDFEAGYYKRAPEIYRKMKIEWIYRIIDNPKKHFVKYLNNLYFPYYLIKDFIIHKK